MTDKTKVNGILIQCGKRYLLVHSTNDWAPIVNDDGNWSYPKGRSESHDGDDLSTAIRETFEETGIDLSNKRNEISPEPITYETKNKIYKVFVYKDKDMSLMNHKFHCDSFVLDENKKPLYPEIDSFYWATKKELEQIIANKHKKQLFKRKSRKK
jgi:8-oxo-dGTP pyrophosphatase MutT (NUDIX family)